MDIYLEQHGYRLTATTEDVDRTFRAVASKQMTEDYFLVWLRSRTELVSSE